jgi:hypothetical protein
MARHDAQENMRKQAAERVRRVVLPDTPLSSRAKSENGAPRQNMLPRPSNAEAERSERRARELPTQERSRPFVSREQLPETDLRGEDASVREERHDQDRTENAPSGKSRAGRAAERFTEALSRRRAGAKAKKSVPFKIRLIRFVFALGILALAFGFYRLWARQAKREALPPMFMPQPYYYEEEQPVHAVLVWREKVIVSPVAGTVQLAAGQKTAAVATNDVVATVLARGRGTPVRVPSRGYFLPAFDGAENSWEYSSLWLGSGILPTSPQLHWVTDLAPLDASRAVGRLIELPQDPRAIFYLNLTDTLKSALERGTLTIRRESRGPKWSARVRVFVKYSEQRAKVCIEMPYFPIDMVSSREVDFLVCSDEDSGLLVPDSAVTIKKGAYGVFELVGDRLIFRRVTGKPVGDGMFFVSSGLSPGNPVIVNAESAEEKRVRLW